MPNTNKDEKMAKEITETLFIFGLPAEGQIISALERAYLLGRVAGIEKADQIVFGKKQPEVINNEQK